MINSAAVMIHHNESNKVLDETGIDESQNLTCYKRNLPNAPVSESLDKRMSLDNAQAKNDSGNGINKIKYYTSKKKKEKRLQTGVSSSKFYVSHDLNIQNEVDKNFTNKTMLKKDFKISDKSNTVSESQTHVALYKFFPRHKDELLFKDGDPIQVLKMNDDLWYEGVNLLTNKQGIFPCRYVADILQKEIISADVKDADHMQFLMRFLGSVEVADFKGEDVLAFAIAKIVNQRSMLTAADPPSCVLQLSNKGIRISDIKYSEKDNEKLNKKVKKGKDKEEKKNEVNDADDNSAHFFSLKNVTFCGNHPKDHRYFGFITKHPDEHRFACHVFMSKFSTDSICHILGECFKSFYESYMEYRAPTEDIYLE
ncbi:C-Jun-amino-terminal kinase-interacting protein 1 isoform X1 [Hydra vulgaris]|uniref:C-Jun-amino-terminal kinase-interacting protein 1 isoform X1 n=1 Tax=Hydra vulgaris TaxID=6087 RepID=UPI000641050F|nr:C-Jun-amino-terminal kinase-interacting protein 1 [Hydra vulgaris]XP_047124591.1 C-Jun-amino-terminal kinase-interacting protein 1 [Hydra vulgaris]